MLMGEIRNDWTKEEVAAIFNLPIMELMYRASVVHRKFQATGEVQVCTLLSVKTGGCPEDCAYCPQASRYHTEVERHNLLGYDEVLTKALIAKENGSTRFCMGANYGDRLKTIENVSNADISVCSGGIIGLGESQADRVAMLHTLATMKKHPESVPVNALVPVKGTPLENNTRVSVWEMIRMIATARIIMPGAMVRLSAGRNEMSVEEQALCFMAGANSIFAGEKLLTTPNPDVNEDKAMFELLGLKPREAYKEVLV